MLGSASNNDGADKISFTAPSVDGQVRVIQEALRDAGIAASGIGYIEAHGSGTPLGDAIEIQALSEAYRLPPGDAHRIGIGSVKASVGHSDASAGLAGFVRTVLCLRHRTLVPTPGFEAPNPLFDGNDAFLEVHRGAQPWTERVIGAVHSVGMGGTNAHVIVGPAPALPARSGTQAPQLILLSARTQPALDAMRVQLAAHLRSHPDQQFADVAWTLQAGRDARPVRHALVAADPVDAARQLETRIVHDLPETDQDLPLRTGLLFPGMGAADLSAMFALHDEVAVFRRALDGRLDALTALSDIAFRRAFAGRRATSGTSAGPGDELDQPIMFALQLSLYDLWRLSSDEPEFVLGYSLGEWTAATVAGVYREEDALALVWERAQLMRAAPSGALLAVHASTEDFEPLRVSGIEIAAYCSRRLLIVGGPEAAIAEQATALERRKIATSRIASPHAYHTGHLRTVAATLDERASCVARRAPRIPFVCLHAGAWADAPFLDDRAYWGRHLAGAVRLEDGIALLNRQSRSVLVELGLGSFLGDLVKISGNPSRHSVFSPFAGTGTRSRAAWLHMLGAAWEAGLPVDAAPLHDEQPRRVPLPTYPFERQRYLVDAAATLEGGVTRHAGEPASAEHRATSHRAPPAAARHDLYAIWEHVFGAPPLDDDAHFFESGGHSLLAIQFLYFVRERLSVELTVADLRANPTAGALRALVDRSRAADRVEP